MGLKNLANESDRTFMEVFKQLTFERFLARVAYSEYRSNLIFKGGLCLRHYVELGRETKDIDFLIKELEGSQNIIEDIFEDITNVNLDDDFIYHSVSVSVLDLEVKECSGFRIRVEVTFGKMKDRMQIDIGVGDIVDELELGIEQLNYKGSPLLGNGSVTLYAYPPEFIFSEKLQAIIELKSFNSRMKDYFDCYVLIQSGVMDVKKVRNAVEKTFKNRNTKVETVDFYEELDSTWESFTKKIQVDDLGLKEVIRHINRFLEKNIL